MDDTIYRQDAIEALEREKTYSTVYRDGYTQTDYFKQYNMGLTDGIKALNKLPSAQPEYYDYFDIDDIWKYYAEEQDINLTDGAKQLKDAMWVGYRKGKQDAQPERKWIPCSERLPEDDTLMLVNYIDNRPDAMDIWIGWHDMENVWYIDGEEHSKDRGNEVLAWMPLPEPYREDE